MTAGLAALGLGGLAAACSRQEVPPSPPPNPGNSPLPSGQPRPSPAASPSPAPGPPPSATPSPAPAGSPDLVVVRGGEPEDMVARALAALGGMERFVRPGNDVIIKPNICVAYNTYEYAATTNPWVVAALVKLALKAGARRVRVMDQPFGGGPEQAYLKSGIQEQVLAAGGEMEIMRNFKFVATDIPLGKDIKKWDIYDDVLKADVLINVPIAKHHNLARLTLGMKNLMGVIRAREQIHQNIGQRLADLLTRIHPALTVVDAVRILTRNGPTGGNLADVKKLDTIIAGTDIVAADSYAAGLFGVKPETLTYVKAAAEMGLGRSDLSKLKIEEISLAGRS